MDKISEDRLFRNNTREQIMYWCRNLKYFHYMRARGGHNCEGDSFSVYFQYDNREDLIAKLLQIGVRVDTLGEGFIAFDPFESYSVEDLDRLKITILEYPDLEQPQAVDVLGYKAHVWVMASCFEISVSGSGDGQTYKVSDSDFEVCMLLEKEFGRLEWKSILDENIETQAHCISSKKYPELFDI